MGTRIRSAMAAPGAVTEIDFIKAFNETKPVPVSSMRELTDKLEDINKTLTNANVDWKKKTVCLTSLRGLLIADFPNIKDVMVDNCSLWERGLIDGMKELRSSLSREYCITVAFFSTKLGVRFFRQINLLFEGLIMVVQNSAKIMASAAYIATEFVAKHVQHPRLINIMGGFISSKCIPIRRCVVHLSEIVMGSWSSDYLESQNLVKIIMEIVKSGCCDADIQCRQMGREAYFVLAEKYPDEARIVFESLDPPRQKMINDSRSAASSSHSIMHERGDLPMNHRLQQNQFMANRSRSDIHFRANSRITPVRNIPGRSKDADKSISPVREPIARKPLFSRPTPVPRPSPAPKPPIRANGSGNSVPAVSSAKIRPSQAPITQTNGSSNVFARPAFGAFGPAKANVSLTKMAPPRIPSVATPATRITPNIKPPTLPRRSSSSLVDVPFNISLNDDSKFDDFTADLNNESLLMSVFEDMKFALSEFKNSFPLSETGPASPLMVSMNKLKECINDGKLLPENVTDEQTRESATMFQAILVLLVTIFKDNTIPAQLRIAALDCARRMIDENPSRIGDKHEFLVMRILECQERNDALLCRAAEDCGTAVIKPLPIERCKELIMPLIESEGVKYHILAAALKLISRKLENLNKAAAEEILLDTKETIIKLYTHQEAVVRRATVIYFVAIASVVGLDRIEPHLPPQMMRMVNVYYDKIMKESALGL